MAKVIVPKNYALSTGMSSATTGANILGSTTIISSTVFMEDGDLGLNYSINFNSANTTYSVNNMSSGYRYITLKNNADYGCNFVILNVAGLPNYKNTGTTILYIQLQLMIL